MSKEIEVVVIHGSHKTADGVVKVGGKTKMSVAALLALDPQFRKGIGERFATPEKAAKLQLKAQLEDELELDDSQPDIDVDEPAVTGEGAPDEKKGKKGKG